MWFSNNNPRVKAQVIKKATEALEEIRKPLLENRVTHEKLKNILLSSRDTQRAQTERSVNESSFHETLIQKKNKEKDVFAKLHKDFRTQTANKQLTALKEKYIARCISAHNSSKKSQQHQHHPSTTVKRVYKPQPVSSKTPEVDRELFDEGGVHEFLHCTEDLDRSVVSQLSGNEPQNKHIVEENSEDSPEDK